MLTLLVCLGLAWCAIVAGVWLIQERLLYLPERIEIAAAESAELRAWPSRDEFRGLIAEPRGAVTATVIVFHGNAGHAGQREYYRWALTDLGVRVILAEYPGYGPRPGRPNERTLVADGGETVALARRLYGEPLILVGESLGAGVAAAVAATHAGDLAGLVLLTPWDRLASVAAHHYPWLPVRMLLRDRYDSRGNLASFAQPVLVAVAERDSIVPARYGTALFESLTGPKRLEVIAGAEHNDWHERLDVGWWPRALDFVGQRRAPR